MTLSWTQDTVGPLCRSAEDCALVFEAIYGPDGRDNSVLDVPFRWDATADVRSLRVGYLRSAFTDRPGESAGDRETPVTVVLPISAVGADDGGLSASTPPHTGAAVCRKLLDDPQSCRRRKLPQLVAQRVVDVQAAVFGPGVEAYRVDALRIRAPEKDLRDLAVCGHISP
jgi:hypothetical protein